MARKIRNVTDDDRQIMMNGRFQTIPAGGVVVVPDEDDTYFQVGDQGEDQIFEEVDKRPEGQTKKGK